MFQTQQMQIFVVSHSDNPISDKNNDQSTCRKQVNENQLELKAPHIFVLVSVSNDCTCLESFRWTLSKFSIQFNWKLVQSSVNELYHQSPLQLHVLEKVHLDQCLLMEQLSHQDSGPTPEALRNSRMGNLSTSLHSVVAGTGDWCPCPGIVQLFSCFFFFSFESSSSHILVEFLELNCTVSVRKQSRDPLTQVGAILSGTLEYWLDKMLSPFGKLVPKGGHSQAASSYTRIPH